MMCVCRRSRVPPKYHHSTLGMAKEGNIERVRDEMCAELGVYFEVLLDVLPLEGLLDVLPLTRRIR